MQPFRTHRSSTPELAFLLLPCQTLKGDVCNGVPRVVDADENQQEGRSANQKSLHGIFPKPNCCDSDRG